MSRIYLVMISSNRTELVIESAFTNYLEGYILKPKKVNTSNNYSIGIIEHYNTEFEIIPSVKLRIPKSNILKMVQSTTILNTSSIMKELDSKVISINKLSRIEITADVRKSKLAQYANIVKTLTSNNMNSVGRSSNMKSPVANLNNNINSSIKIPIVQYKIEDSRFNNSTTSKSWIDIKSKEVIHSNTERILLEEVIYKKSVMIEEEQIITNKEVGKLKDVSILKKNGYDTLRNQSKRIEVLESIIPSKVSAKYVIHFLQGQIKQKSAIKDKDFSKSITAWTNDVLYLKKKYKL